MKNLLNKYVTAYVPSLGYPLQGVLISVKPPRIRCSDLQEHVISGAAVLVTNPPKLHKVPNSGIKADWELINPTAGNGNPSVVSREGNQICDSFYNNARDGVTNVADAQLTSRAPAMLKQLKAQLKFLNSLSVDGLNIERLRKQCEAVRVEIAQAEYWIPKTKN